jgi:microcystin-dependent protein
MSDPFISEIRMMSFNYAPKGWATCDGQLLAINQNQAMFSLLGTVYGGDGRTTFGLPDLRGRVPTHMGGQGHILGERGGEATHTLSIPEMPAHPHVASGSATTTGNVRSAANAVLAGGLNVYGPANSLTSLNSTSLGNAGGSQPHPNMQPFLTLNFSIALQGIFPSRT